jgi:hypothetical protein
MGQVFTKDEIIDLADDIIWNTKHSKKLIEYCKKRGIEKNEENLNERLAGNRWYANFMKRNEDALEKGKCRIYNHTK